MIPDLPERVIELLFNLQPGAHEERYCRKCEELTDQVQVSFSDVPGLRDSEAERFVGRVLDYLPGIPLFGGRPTACKCGAVNR
jgi:hypothetical protein